MEIKPKSLGGFVRCISGVFITKNNPNGITPKECNIIAALITLLDDTGQKVITKEIKVALANLGNHSLQVAINYVNKLKLKGVILQDDTLHPIFLQDKVIIEYGNRG